MIYIDELKKLKQPIRRCKYHAHLITSNIDNELIKFVQDMGLKVHYIQKVGTKKEHYDIFGKKNYWKAIILGATSISNKELIEIIKTKERLIALNKIKNSKNSKNYC